MGAGWVPRQDGLTSYTGERRPTRGPPASVRADLARAEREAADRDRETRRRNNKGGGKGRDRDRGRGVVQPGEVAINAPDRAALGTVFRVGFLTRFWVRAPLHDQLCRPEQCSTSAAPETPVVSLSAVLQKAGAERPRSWGKAHRHDSPRVEEGKSRASLVLIVRDMFSACSARAQSSW